jgi:carbonic anhydrase
MAGSFVQTEYVPYDFDVGNRYFSENEYPVPDPIAGDRSRTGIICCADPRCTPETFFKLRYKEAFCVRNEGGRTADSGVIRTILLIDCIATSADAKIEEIMVIHHTGK